jgi:hypothetical protein
MAGHLRSVTLLVLASLLWRSFAWLIDPLYWRLRHPIVRVVISQATFLGHGLYLGGKFARILWAFLRRVLRALSRGAFGCAWSRGGSSYEVSVCINQARRRRGYLPELLNVSEDVASVVVALLAGPLPVPPPFSPFAKGFSCPDAIFGVRGRCRMEMYFRAEVLHFQARRPTCTKQLTWKAQPYL